MTITTIIRVWGVNESGVGDFSEFDLLGICLINLFMISRGW